jgi:hypothetical protein
MFMSTYQLALDIFESRGFVKYSNLSDNAFFVYASDDRGYHAEVITVGIDKELDCVTVSSNCRPGSFEFYSEWIALDAFLSTFPEGFTRENYDLLVPPSYPSAWSG